MNVGDYFIGKAKVGFDAKLPTVDCFIVGKIIGKLGEGFLFNYYAFDFDGINYLFSTGHNSSKFLLNDCLIISEDVWEKCELMFKDRSKIINLKLDIMAFKDFLDSKRYFMFYETMKEVYGKG